MSLFLFEMRKVWRRRSILLLIIVCSMLNAFLVYQQEKGHSLYYSPESYRQLVEEMEVIPLNEAYEELQMRKCTLEADGTKFNELQLVQDALQEVENVAKYGEYIQEIQEQADRMLSVSIFGGANDYANRNVLKTAEDFSELENLILEFGMARGITAAAGSEFTDLFGILLLVLVCTFLVLTEKQKGGFAVISPCAKGQTATAIAKIVVLLVSSIGIYGALYAGNFLVAFQIYGVGPMDRLVQSVWDYRTSILIITIRQYLILFSLCKIFLYVLVGLIGILLGLMMKNASGFFLSLCGLVAMSGGMYVGIPENHWLSLLKYTNLFYFFQTDVLLMKYKNVNFFGKPVSILAVFVICSMGLILMTVISVVFLMRGKYILSETKSGRVIRRKKLPCTILYFEFLKNWIRNGAIVVLMLFILVQGLLAQNIPRLTTVNEIYHRIYMQYMGGEIGTFTEEYVKKEDARYEALMNDFVNVKDIEEAGRIQEQLAPYEAWNQVKSEYQTLVSQQEVTERELWVVYPKGYVMLMGDNKRLDYQTGVLLVVVLVAGLSSIFAGDNAHQMTSLLHTTAKGRKVTLRSKIFLVLCFTVVAWLIAYGGDYLKIHYYYGMDGFSAPIQSIPMFFGIEKEGTIGNYLLILAFVKLIGAFAAAMGIVVVSLYGADVVRTMIFAMLFLGIPSLACMLGADVVEHISLQGLLSGSGVVNAWLAGVEGAWLPVFGGVVWIVMAAGICYRKVEIK